MYANVNGAIGKAQSIITAAQTSNSHIITLAETKLPTDPPDITGYSWITKNRTNHKGGGVAILVRNDIKHRCQQINDLEDQNQDICWVQIQTNNSAIYVGVYYGKQEHAPLEEIKAEFAQLTAQVINLKQRGEIILTGDFNAKLEIKTGSSHNTKAETEQSWKNSSKTLASTQSHWNHKMAIGPEKIDTMPQRNQ